MSSKKANVSYGKNNYSLKDLRHRYISIGTDFLSEFPSLSSKILSGFSGYILARDAFCLGLLPYKKKNVFALKILKGPEISRLEKRKNIHGQKCSKVFMKP